MSKEQLANYGSYKGYVSLLESNARQSGDLGLADFLRDNQQILEELQKAHDGDKCDVIEMRDRLSAVARTFNLNYDSVAKIQEWNG